MTRLFILFQYLLPHHLLSRGVGVLAQNHLLRKLFIRAFIKRYKVDLSQAKIQEVDKLILMVDTDKTETKEDENI